MAESIKDGTGSGDYGMRVDKENRAYVRSISEPEVLHAAETGHSYNINTGLITSIACDSGVLYVKNTSTSRNVIIESIIVAEFCGITHSNKPYITIIANPTGGTLISAATNADMISNRTIGSSTTLDVDAYKGANGSTVTGGANLAIIQTVPAGRTSIPINLLIPQSQSIAIKITPNATSGSASYYFALVLYTKDRELS